MAVTIQQAAANALAAFLATALPDVDIQDAWPDPENRFHNPRITLIQVGPREDTPIDLRQLSATNSGATQTNVVWQIALCEQTFQLDVWTTNAFKRDDILARLDDVTCGDPGFGAGHGLYLPALVADGWGDTYFDYYFESPHIHDTTFQDVVDEYRASFICKASMMLTVNRTTARQLVGQFQETITETDPVSIADTYHT